MLIFESSHCRSSKVQTVRPLLKFQNIDCHLENMGLIKNTSLVQLDDDQSPHHTSTKGHSLLVDG